MNQSFIDFVRSSPSIRTTLRSQPWWEVGQGWRVHLGLNQFFCYAWNRYSGEISTWPDLIPQLYPETNRHLWFRLVSGALVHGKKLKPHK